MVIAMGEVVEISDAEIRKAATDACLNCGATAATPRTPGKLSLETPAGRVDIEYDKPGDFVESVRMFNVASYLHSADVGVDVPGIGTLVVDIAYGGNYYAVVEPQPNWAGLDGCSVDNIVSVSRRLRTALEAAATIGPHKGILPSVGGWARIIGHNTIFVDDRDPLAHGFQLT